MSDYALFEESGTFRAATIQADQNTTLQVELPGGKRQKLKAAQVLLRFKTPAPAQLLPAAEPMAADMDPAFLWECAPETDFGFTDIAADYFGHSPSAIESTALLLAMQNAPLYFHRRGKGMFRRAPPEILKAALAGAEKKRLQAEAIERMVAQLVAGSLPTELIDQVDALLVQPDRNRPEIKAFEVACAQTKESPAALLLRCGAFPDAYHWHFRRFAAERFPKGIGFPELPEPAAVGDLPLADVQAVSIDDATTTEIDDALSVTRLPGIGWRIGVHIAAPGLGILPGSAHDAVARARLSTVYMPGHKITMLPDDLVARFTLAEGKACPALSLYLNVSDDFEILSHESRVERVPIAANLRLHEIEPHMDIDRLNAGDIPDCAHGDTLRTLWRFAGACAGRRGKPSAQAGLHDYHYQIDGPLHDKTSGAILDPAACRVHIEARKRGSPVDMLVAELMILANATWGQLLADKGVPGLYRGQVAGKVRMTTSAIPHEGLGVACYAWSTSPLRRYSDLINQWQLIAALSDKPAPFAPRSAELFAAMRDFDLTYAGYADFQRRMERYWCLRWLQQTGTEQVEGTVMRNAPNVRVDGLPLVVQVPSAPDLPVGSRMSLTLGAPDLLELSVHSRFENVLAGVEIATEDDLELLDEVPVEDALAEAEEEQAEASEPRPAPEAHAPDQAE
ncbi:ribonuclease catalytic domain-containing protein [Fluviibacter phosphoraccumulans]|uniref:Ribonuclease II n=1 Tax=Fluviibacter phosphoraccumulans TaxID=1751046 RepID=A0A679I986_9RHOO|nr:RNB domain-containing ribonuclease [Fluviibacter phosphoraccumulans]BBU68441.1 ribonuclease II [Fluviibacter phosphoraccumulans]BBU72404.1 ribonuclease II [Fluviibacter phosphoraccumulans]BCA66624.1 ribonuclease II [Fluviibacter phosphoraccumulans]